MSALDLDQIGQRWPRFLWAVRQAALLSDTEARACIRDFKAARWGSSEAVDHFGGCAAVVEAAARRWRSMPQKMRAADRLPARPLWEV